MGKAQPRLCQKFLRYSDIVIANEEDCQNALGISTDVEIEEGYLDIRKYESLSNKRDEKISKY